MKRQKFRSSQKLERGGSLEKAQRNKQIKLRGTRLAGHMPVILAFGRWRQENCEFSILLSFIV